MNAPPQKNTRSKWMPYLQALILPNKVFDHPLITSSLWGCWVEEASLQFTSTWAMLQKGFVELIQAFDALFACCVRCSNVVNLWIFEPSRKATQNLQNNLFNVRLLHSSTHVICTLFFSQLIQNKMFILWCLFHSNDEENCYHTLWLNGSSSIFECLIKSH